jgi:hypothetical protein
LKCAIFWLYAFMEFNTPLPHWEHYAPDIVYE